MVDGSDKLTRKFTRWALILHEYDFQVVHKPGVAKLDADGLSRNPCTNQEDNTRAKWHGKVYEEMVLGWHASTFFYALPSSLVDPFEGLTMWKCGKSWNLEPLSTSSTKGGERGVLEVPGLD